MSDLNISLVAVGGLVLALGLVSRQLERTVLSAPLVALLLGILLGPAVSGLLQPVEWVAPERLLEEAARLTMAIAIMGVALRLPPGYAFRQWRSLAVILGVAMPLMCVSSGLLAHWLLGLPLLAAMLVGAVLTPTDPVVATSIVTGTFAKKNIPARVRHILSAESAANDGLAYPLVLIFVLLSTRTPGDAWIHWVTRTLFWEVGGAIIFGIILGLSAGRLLRAAELKKMMEPPSFLAYTLALSLLVLGGASLLGTEGIVAVFVAGVAFDQMVGGKERAQEERVQEAVNQFFTLPIFTLFGLMLPWQAWVELGWRGWVFAGVVLLFRRIPVFLLLRASIPELKARKEVLFAGWFGPIGVAAIFYAMLVLRRLGYDVPWNVGSLVICLSLVAHGMTGAPIAKRYGRERRGRS